MSRRSADRARRALRTVVRRRSRASRAAAGAVRAVATGQPQPLRTRLVPAGLDDATARRFAGAFSRGVTADATRQTRVKFKGRVTKRVAVKLYAARTFAARLAIYRPKDATAAAAFARLALGVAAR